MKTIRTVALALAFAATLLVGGTSAAAKDPDERGRHEPPAWGRYSNVDPLLRNITWE